MLAACRSLRASRLSAVLVALALSGAPAMVEALAGEHEHACRCHHGKGERCTCASCRRAAARARRADLDALPPCHRAAAEAALARAERDGSVADAFTGCCPPSARDHSLLAGRDPFLPAASVALHAPARASWVHVERTKHGGDVPEPPEPPPRA